MNQSRYWIIDQVSDEEPYLCQSKKEFIDSLMYNREIAIDCGDEAPLKKELIKRFKDKKDHEESINGFGYVKTTNKSLGYYGY